MRILQGVNLGELERTLSAPRLSSYQALIATTDLAPTLGSYLWNLEVGAALHPIVSTIEVAIRNAIHCAAVGHYGKPDWFGTALRHAGDRQWTTLVTRHPRNLSSYYRSTAAIGNKKKLSGQPLKRWRSPAEGKMEETQTRLTKAGKGQTPDQIVASVMFGFWVDLLHESFEDASATALWPHCFASAFDVACVADRATMETLLKRLKRARNEISHHEPIWKTSAGSTPIHAEAELSSLVATIEQVIAAVSPSLRVVFERTGLLPRLRWLTASSTLRQFSATPQNDYVDRRKLTRRLRKTICRLHSDPLPVGQFRPTRVVSISDSGQPYAVVTSLI